MTATEIVAREAEVVLPVFEEVRRSRVSENYDVWDFVDAPAGKPMVLAAELDRTVPLNDAVKGRYLAVIDRDPITQRIPMHGVFLWNTRYRRAPDGGYTAAPLVIYRMAFDGKLHVFQHRFDPARPELPLAELTIGHVRKHLSDSFSFFRMHADGDSRPW